LKRIDAKSKELILAALKATKSSINHINAGVCGNVADRLARNTNNIKDLVKANEEWQRFTWTFLHKWPKSNHDRAYPIPGGIDTYEEHYDEGTLWVGEQSELRTELICKLIENLKG